MRNLIFFLTKKRSFWLSILVIHDGNLQLFTKNLLSVLNLLKATKSSEINVFLFKPLFSFCIRSFGLGIVFDNNLILFISGNCEIVGRSVGGNLGSCSIGGVRCI